jgi:hypothetical protein
MTSRPPKLRDIREAYDPDAKPESTEAHEDEFLEPVPEGPYVHVAEYIPVREWGQVWPFMKMSMRIYQFSRNCPGFLAGGIRGKWWKRQFWSYTVWQDREAMLHFAQTPPHSEAAGMIEEVAAEGACYVEWSSMSPPDWDEALERLRHPTRYFVPPGPR